MFYIINNNSILGVDDDLDRLKTTIEMNPQYARFEIKETDLCTAEEYQANNTKWIVEDDTLVLNTNYEDEQTKFREKQFKQNFIKTSLGWYRQTPQGYANALQSIHSIDKMVMAFQGFTEEISKVMIFYKEPNFSDEKQCTEEWLVSNSFNPEVMTIQEWSSFSAQFELLWASEMYKKGA